MNRHLFKGACLFTGLALLATPAQADRRTSLAGNDLIQDADDVFLFPQTLHTYQNRLTLDLGAAAGAGGGLFAMGNDSMTFGAAIHRAPQGQTTNGWQSRDRELNGLGGYGLGLPNGIGLTPGIENIDLLFGMSLSSSLDLGVRLGLGRGLAWQDQEVPDGDGTRSQVDSTDQNGLHFSAGASYKTSAMHVDGALRVAKLGGSQIADGKTVLSASDMDIGLAARAFFNMSKGFDVGAVFGFNNGSGWALNQADPDQDITSVWTRTGVVVGAGPRVQIDDGPLVAAYAVVAYGTSYFDPDNHPDATDDTGNPTGVMLPGIRMAAEYPVKPWMKTRAGMEYNFATATSYGHAGGNPLNTQGYSSDFGWNAGLGFTFGHLQLDATLNHGSLYFLWQDAPFAMVSATYSFGKLKGSKPSRRIERRAEPDAEPAAPEEPTRRSDPVDSDDDF